MGVPSIELVTLSDSLTLSFPKPKRKQNIGDQGARKIVCLDSDTESDGSYGQATVNSVALKATHDKFCDDLSNGSEKWLGLRACENQIRGESGNCFVSLEGKSEKDTHKTFNAVKHSEGTSDVGSDALMKRSTENINWTDVSHSSLDHIDRPDGDHLDLKSDNNSSDVDLCSVHSPVISLERHFSSGNLYLSDSRMPSASCKKVRKCLSPSPSMELPKTYSPSLSSASKDSASCSLPAWDDHLKNIITELGSSKEKLSPDKCINHALEQEREYGYLDHDSDDEIYHGDYSFLKNTHYKCNAGIAVARGKGDCFKHQEETAKVGSCEIDGLDSKATAKNIGSSMSSENSINDSLGALDKETMKLKKNEKCIKDTEEKEAKRQQLRLERDLSRKGKQEEKKKYQELRKLRNEEEKKRKEILKAEAAERRKLEKEKEKWEKGKFALQNITALVDTQILESGLIGGHLLTRFAEKGFKYHVVRNPVTKTVVWQTKLPSKESQIDLHEEGLSQEPLEPNNSKNVEPQLSLETVDVSYVLIVLEADEFLDMITNDILDSHIRSLQKRYPGFMLGYLINKLKWFLQKREQQHFNTPNDNWRRPPVEQILAQLVTSYDGVHSRLCVDEAEISEHIVGLTRSLAECPFKRRLTPLSLCANGDHVVKSDPYGDEIKKDVWLKALVALPKVSGSCAIAISKKYPSMSALFEAYLDPLKTVYEKEHLLQDLMKEGLLGSDHNRRIGPVCSKRIFRILMAEHGNLHTNDVDGAGS